MAKTKVHPLADVRAQCEADLREAGALVQRAQQALDAATRRALIAQGKAEGIAAAIKALYGDQ